MVSAGDKAAMRIEMKAIDAIKPYDRNPRKNQGAVTKVAASLSEFGWQQPIVVDAEMVIIVGHTRWKAAQLLDMKTVPVVVAKNLSPEQARAYRIADNRTNEEAEWDKDLLKIELGELEGLGVSLALTGFDDDELRGLLEAGGIDIAPEDDEAGSGIDPVYLSFGRNKIPIAEDELHRLEMLLRQYVEIFSLNHGFGRWLCEKAEEARAANGA